MLSATSGYLDLDPAASMRERLYVSPDWLAADLSASGVRWQLGGVIGKAAPKRLGPSIEEALLGLGRVVLG